MMYNYTINPESDEPIMLLDRHIGGWDDDTATMGIDGNDFARELLFLDTLGKKCINVWINSVGGSVVQGYSIYNAILNSKTKVDTYNTGIAASTAGWIFQAGRKRSMADYALCMMHNVSPSDKTDALWNNSVATMLSTRSNRPIEEVLDMMKKETWMTASECLMNGMCDEVVNSASANKKRVSAANAVKDNWKICAEITNSALNISTTKKESNMSNFATIANHLGLDPEASSEAVVRQIQTLKNLADTAKMNLAAKDKEIEKLTNQISEADKNHKTEIDNLTHDHSEVIKEKDNEIVNIRNEYKAKEDRLARLEQEQKEATEKAQLSEIQNYLKDQARVGRIKNEVVEMEKWEDLGMKQGIDYLKNLVEAIPLNKVAPVIHTTNTNTKAPQTTAAYLAAQNRLRREGKLN